MATSFCYASECYPFGVDITELSAYRQKRVRELVDLKFEGSKAALGRAMGFRDGAYIGQMISGLRPVNEKTIRQFEALPGIAGWFSMVPESPAQTQAQDISYAIGSTPNVLAFAEKIKLLPETQRKILAILLSDLILQPDKAQDIAPEVARLLGDQQPGKSFQPSFTTLKSGSNG